MAKQKETQKLIANNKKAYHDYFIDESYEAGIALHGTEVKSLRMGKCSIKESFIRIENGEMFVYGMHVSPYEKGNIFNKDPLQVYFKEGRAKVQIGLARGKKLYDKREDIAKKDARRETEREFKVKNL